MTHPARNAEFSWKCHDMKKEWKTSLLGAFPPFDFGRFLQPHIHLPEAFADLSAHPASQDRAEQAAHDLAIGHGAALRAGWPYLDVAGRVDQPGKAWGSVSQMGIGDGQQDLRRNVLRLDARNGDEQVDRLAWPDGTARLPVD